MATAGSRQIQARVTRKASKPERPDPPKVNRVTVSKIKRHFPPEH